jgi:hypothetical protein
MSIRSLCFATLFAVVGVLSNAPDASAQGLHFFAVLAGGNEVSDTGQADAGDPNGHGAAAVMIPSGTEICIAVLVNRIGDPTAMHIHENTAGENGPIVVPFNPPRRGNPGHASQCVEAPAAVIDRIRRNPSRFYVNVHTEAFPAGAVRGQLF